MGRFVVEDDSSDEIDIDAAFYHLKHSANLGEIEALVNISKIYMQLPRDILPDYKVEVLNFLFKWIDSFCSYLINGYSIGDGCKFRNRI